MSKMSHGVAATGLRQGMARVAAVMIVPLMASIDIHASSVLPITNFSCTTSTDGGVPVSCPAGAGVSQLSDPGNGIQGLKFFTGGAVDYLASTAANLRFNASGRLIGTIDAGTVIPVSYDFTIEPEGSVDFWTLQYILLSGMIPFAEFDSSGRGTGTFQFKRASISRSRQLKRWTGRRPDESYFESYERGFGATACVDQCPITFVRHKLKFNDSS